MPVSYWINDRGSPQISNGSDFPAVNAAFQTWQSIPSANISFKYQGTTATRSVAQDGLNIVTFSDDSSPLGSTVLAATFSFYGTVNGQFTTLDADIAFNPAFQWSTSGETGKYDIQSVLTHEIGHFLGLDHSPLISSVMVPFGALGLADQRTLLYDDIAGVSEIYPGAAAAVGQIRGSIRSGTAGVFGAHVVAIDRDGTPLVSTLSASDGSYVITFLPSGDYRVYAEPIDLPVNSANISGFYGSARTDFGTTYFGNVSTLAQAQTVQVSAGSAVTADIQVLPRSLSGLNVTTPSFGPRLARGSTVNFRLGGVDLSSGLTVASSSPVIGLGFPIFGGSISANAPSSVTLSVDIPLNAPLGPKNLSVNRGADTAVLSGAMVVVPPMPSVSSVSPLSALAQTLTRVTVGGSNFRSGARVYFGGLAATDVHVLSANLLDALTPAAAPATVNVQVFNADGTNGVATNAFTFLPSNAFISRIAPLSGGPMTAVTIEGDHFSSSPQNLAVRFNGVAAPIVSASTTQIQTIVPYGATSGPITVTMFGQTATGPVFSVTEAAASANLAPGGYEFMDASAAAGGSNLNFSSVDDGVAAVTLPFSFSLFRDIYVAGALISVTTNGWISLQPVGTVEFQNGPLPGKSPPGNSATSSEPAALIAPFFDDLLMVPGSSSISTRVVGTAPNRRLIVQWTKMTILNDAGDNLNASLTFQAVLFEGSNDIQFVYQTMNGSRSDGSSATVGLQDASRTTGVQTGYNESVVGSGSVVTYRFRNGQYAQAGADATPPTKPVVIDIGPRTNSMSQLSASWTADDPETGIEEFQYAIGTSPGASDVLVFTSTANNSATVAGLALQAGGTYYFAVRAVNNAGLMSDVGISAGVFVDPGFQPYTSIIPYAPQDGGQFGGISFVAAAPTSVVLTAMDANGFVITGTGIQNPKTLSLAAGRQTAKLISEFFGIPAFDGWIQVDASVAGLSVYSATGTASLDDLDGVVPRDPSTDFLALHSGALLYLVNPSPRAASVTIAELGAGGSVRTLSIAARNRISTTLTAPSEIRSSEPLAATERFQIPGRLGLATPQPASFAQSNLTFAYGLTGAGYTTNVTLANTSNVARDLTVSFTAASAALRLEPYSARTFSLADFLGLSAGPMRTGTVRITSAGTNSALFGVADIENSVSRTSIEARPALTSTLFVNVFQGNGWYTGLSIATGSNAAAVTIDVYPEVGGTPKSEVLNVGANQQTSRQLSEFVPSVATQFGGYIRVSSDQPIWVWQIYGTPNTMASGPPQ